MSGIRQSWMSLSARREKDGTPRPVCKLSGPIEWVSARGGVSRSPVLGWTGRYVVLGKPRAEEDW